MTVKRGILRFTAPSASWSSVPSRCWAFLSRFGFTSLGVSLIWRDRCPSSLKLHQTGCEQAIRHQLGRISRDCQWRRLPRLFTVNMRQADARNRQHVFAAQSFPHRQIDSREVMSIENPIMSARSVCWRHGKRFPVKAWWYQACLAQGLLEEEASLLVWADGSNPGPFRLDLPAHRLEDMLAALTGCLPESVHVYMHPSVKKSSAMTSLRSRVSHVEILQIKCK